MNIWWIRRVAREELFGHEPSMEEPEVSRKRVGRPWGADDDDYDDDDDDDIVKRVGPWGAVRR